MADPEPSAAALPDPRGSGIARRRAAARDGSSRSYSLRRDEIVRAAAVAFKRHGYDGTSLADVAEAVGSDRASLYYYVGGKEELVDAVVTDVVVANALVAEVIRDGSGSAPEKLRELVTSLMTSYAEHYPFLYVYLQEDLTHVADTRRAWAQEMRQVNRRWEAAVTAIVEQGLAEGTMRTSAPARETAYGLIGMVSWTSRWFNPTRSPVDAATIGETYARLLLDGLEVS